MIKNNIKDGFRPIKHSILETQHFDEKLNFTENEVFLDCGCFGCGTTKDFIITVDGKYDKIIAFEPDKVNYENCLRIIENENLNDISVVNMGLWYKKLL